MIYDVNNFYKIPDDVETRWASAENPKGEKGKGGQANDGRKGSPSIKLGAGQSYILAEEQNCSGTVRRIWITIADRSAEMLRGIRLDFFWDGSSKPAVSAPIGDFFGVGLGRTAAFESALFTNPEGRSFVCYIPMPFKKGMKMIVTNETSVDQSMLFYDVNYTIGDEHDDNILYFNAHYRRENPTTLLMDYEILPKVIGKGRFLGCNIGVKVDKETYFKSWWGEGEVKIYLDGDTDYPTLCGTGTEDYIGTGWGQGCYHNLYQGCTVADAEMMHYCFYRYHVLDSVYFRKDIRVTIQQIGFGSQDVKPFFLYNGSTIYSIQKELLNFAKIEGNPDSFLFERHDDWSSCAYFYLDNPQNNLPEIDPVEKRIK